MTGPWGRGLWSIFHRDSRRTESLFVAIIVRYAFCVENSSIHVSDLPQSILIHYGVLVIMIWSDESFVDYLPVLLTQVSLKN